MALKLTRPLVFFDLETTGTNITRDRIVEISIIKVYPDRKEPVQKKFRVNPERPIPAEATAVHHITDDDVRNEKPFRELAQGIADTFKGCDIAGFNSNKFDLPLLCEEMGRAGVLFDLRGVHLIDVQTIFHKKEPRNLTAAYKLYCGKNLDAAHSADGDTLATYEVFMAQLERYDDLPATIEGIAEFSKFDNTVDLMGRLARNEKGQVVFNFGQHKGKPVADVLRKERSYYDWMMNADFPIDTKQHLTEIFKTINSK